MKPMIQVTSELKSLLDTTVGFVRINKSWVHHNNSYECAAWWEDSKIQEGVYPLILKKNSSYPNEMYLYAELSAVVVDDYFPALWGGVAISKTPYTAKNLGEKRIIRERFDLVDSIDKTGNSTSDIDICVNPMLWEAIINAARESLNNCTKIYDDNLKRYQSSGDGDYDANLSMIHYSAENIAALSNAIMILKRRQSYIVKGTEHMRNLYAQNTAWANAA